MRHFARCFTLLFASMIAFYPLHAAGQQIAATPPMGWNSWDSYGLTITQSEFKQNVDWLNTHLKSHGWQYVVVDEGWYLQHPENAAKKGADQGYTMDANGRYQPAPNRFPSAVNGAGMKALADYAHSRGLKFGIHIIRGIPREAVEKNLPIAGTSYHAADAADRSDTCRWNPDNYGLKANAAGQAYYNSIAQLYASWGVDFLKVDCISEPYKANAIHMVSVALARSGRPIVLSLSPGPTSLGEANDVRKYAQMWRISADMWDVWSKHGDPAEDFLSSLKGQFGRVAAWSPYRQDGHWPDADMLPIGTLGPRPGWGTARRSHFTPDEARTLITLWSIGRSPLMLGANMTQMDPLTESLLTNNEILAVDQHSTGNKPVIQTPGTVVWTAKAADGGDYVAIFNLDDSPHAVTYRWEQLGFHAGNRRVRDLWKEKDLGGEGALKAMLAPHASAIYKVR